jgi:hypothetical protein
MISCPRNPRHVALALVALALCAPPLGSGNIRQAGVDGIWSGTITWNATAGGDVQTSPPTGGVVTTHVERTENAVYTVTGPATTDGLIQAQMTGSATGRVTQGCSDADPYYGWTYQGPARVQIAFQGGQFVVRPLPVAVSPTYQDKGCGPSSGASQTIVVPGYRGVVWNVPDFVFQESAPEDATTLKGSTTVPWTVTNSLGTFQLGSVTISWDLQRQLPAAPPPPPASPSPSSSGAPSGVASGSVFVDGAVFSSGSVAYGSRVDVTGGVLQLTTRAGSLRVFGGGVSAVFVLAKSAQGGKPLDVLRLVGGDFSVCARRGFRVVSRVGKKKPPGKVVRRLWARGTGSFQTRGRYSYTTVRGTYWLTADRCDGTLTQVKQGTVDVNDLHRHKHVLVTAGKSYLARRP